MSKIAENKALEAYPIVVSEQTIPCRLSYSEGYDQAMQDFLEKALKFLRHELYHTTSQKDLEEQFKNYMKNESED